MPYLRPILAPRAHRRRRWMRGLGDLPFVSSATPAASAALSTAGPNPLLVQAPVPGDPLNFVSPQSAIAAGLDPTAVNAAWTAQVNSFPSVTSAIQAGIAPGVVTELWQGGSPPVTQTWWQRYGVLLAAGGVALGLMFAGNKGDR
jgi:hypothetical protein